MPAWIVIENLEIRGARPENTFTGRSGLRHYASNASSIYIEKGQHIVVRGCTLTDCSNGFFCASQTTDLLVEANRIDDNGNVGSGFEHNNYTEALGITFQFNHFGRLRAGAGGNNLKDRSAGTVIRYNWIEGGNRQLDLVDSDAAPLYGDPIYRSTFVYGNILVETGDDGNSQIVHYGGDGATPSHYRKGTLYFHHNTMVSRRSGNTTLARLSTADEQADARNNVLLVTATGDRFAFRDGAGVLTATRNWVKPGWRASFGGGTIIDTGQVASSSPGFVDLAGDDFELITSSVCIDTAAAPHPATVAEHLPRYEYLRHQMSRARLDDGAPDLGAYEFGPSAGVAGESRDPTGDDGAGPIELVAWPNPSSTRFSIRLAGVARQSAAAAGRTSSDLLEIVDVSGRCVAVLEPDEPGTWSWVPHTDLPAGLYFARLGRELSRLARLK